MLIFFTRFKLIVLHYHVPKQWKIIYGKDSIPALETFYKESCCTQRKEGFKQSVLTDSTIIIIEPTCNVQYKDPGITWKYLGLNCFYCEYEKLLYKGKTKIKPRIKFDLSIIPVGKVANGKVITHFFKTAVLVPTRSL